MPAPKATGIHGSNRPAPVSARAQPCNFATSENHASKPGCEKPPARAAARGGHVPALLWLPPRSATTRTPVKEMRHQNRDGGWPPATGGLSFSDLFRESITQADGPIEHRSLRRGAGIAHEITLPLELHDVERIALDRRDRKSTRLNSSHGYISSAVS